MADDLVDHGWLSQGRRFFRQLTSINECILKPHHMPDSCGLQQSDDLYLADRQRTVELVEVLIVPVLNNRCVPIID